MKCEGENHKTIAEYYLSSLRDGGLNYMHVQTNRISQEQPNECESRLNPSDLFPFCYGKTPY